MKYRYHTGRALRIKSQPFGQFDGIELKSEDFDSFEEFLATAVELEIELITDLEELEGDDDDEADVTD